MAKQPVGDDSVGRMEFMLTMRRRGIGDAAVLRALDEVPREHFVEAGFQDAAYADQALPIACGQTISQPYVVAYMTEQLDVQPRAQGARDRHRLGLPGRGPVAAGAARWSASSATARWRTRRARGWRRSAITTSRSVAGDGLAGAPDAGAVRPHHRHRGGRERAAGAGRAARRRRHAAAAARPAWRRRSSIVKLTKAGGRARAAKS